MFERKTLFVLLAVLFLAFLAGSFAYPQIINRGVYFLNENLRLNLPSFPEKPFILGLDLQGGVHLVYEADLSDIEEGEKSQKMDELRDLIERRINVYGVTEPLVQVQGNNRLIVELAGIKDVDEAIDMIGETPYLEFLESRSEEEIENILEKREELEDKEIEEYDEEDWRLITKDPFFQPTELTGEYLDRVSISFDQTTNLPQINLIFDSKGAELFEEITERNIGKPLAINLDGLSIVDTTGDGKITSEDRYAPIVQDKISGGRAVITGNMDMEKAREIRGRLRSGALPVRIGEPISQRTVGPTLGRISLQESLNAGLFGLGAVVIFMIIFYKLPGFLASISLAIYVTLVLALFKLIPVTLTLAGIGGFILSIGMAVDANILIFSRMREELKKERSFSGAITEGFRRAWPSIRDGNTTTLIIALILFFFGTSFIKGFALTLGIGILLSMFSAIIITKSLLKIFEGTRIQNWKWLWK